MNALWVSLGRLYFLPGLISVSVRNEGRLYISGLFDESYGTLAEDGGGRLTKRKLMTMKASISAVVLVPASRGITKTTVLRGYSFPQVSPDKNS